MVRKRTLLFLLFAAIFALPSSDADVTLFTSQDFTSVGLNLNNICTISADDVFVAWYDPKGNVVPNAGDVKVVVDGAKRKLQFTDVTEAMAGVYKCKSQNDEKTYTVYIEFAFDTSVVKEQDLILNKDSIISCAITSGYPLPVFTFRKEGVVIPSSSSRHVFYPNGTLLVKSVVESDAGNYSCHVSQADDARSDSKDFIVSVVEPPTFTQQPVSKSATKSYDVSFKCKAEGVPTPEIKWYRFGEISTGGRYVISADGTFTIKDVREVDVGEYRCEASNRVNKIEATTQIDAVYVPPKITLTNPSPVNVGNNLEVLCVATGTAPISHVWKRVGTTLEQTITSSSSTLRLTNIQIEDAGVYTCEASNAARDESGDQIIDRKNIDLQVNSPPVINTEMTTSEVYTWVGTTTPITLVCVSGGYPYPSIQIKKNNVVVTGKETTEDGKYTLEILADEAEDVGEYTCIASNTFGSDSASMQVLTASVPGLPTGLTLTPTCESIRVSWTKPANDGGVPITNYMVNLIKDGETVRGKSVDGLLTFYTFQLLDRQAGYSVTVNAINAVGGGGAVTETTYTLFECPPTPPVITSPTAEQLKSDSITLEWSAAVANGNDDDITYVVMYALYYIDGSDGEWTEKEAGSSLSLEITGLQLKKMYSFKVKASNSGGTVSSQVRRYTTPEAAPEVLARKSGLDGGAVAGIVIAIILIVLIVVDLFCCFFNECGFIHCCCQTFFAKGESSKGSKYAADEKKSSGKELEPLKKDPAPAVV